MDTVASPKRKLRNLLIMPGEQLKHVFIMWLAVSMGMGLVCLFFLAKLRGVGDAVAGCDSGAQAVEGMATTIMSVYVGAVILFGIIYGALNIVLTHEIFGALFVIERHLENALKGQYDVPLQPRKNDQVKKMIELTSELVDKMKAMDKKNN
jgi:hypothetical protein